MSIPAAASDTSNKKRRTPAGRSLKPTFHQQSVLSVRQRWLPARPRPDRQEPQPHVPTRCRIGGARLVSIRRSTHGYARFNGTTWTTYPTDEPVGGFQAAVDANGTLWATTNGELTNFDGTTRTAYPSPFTRP